MVRPSRFSTTVTALVAFLTVIDTGHAQTTRDRVEQLLSAYHTAGMFDGTALVAEAGEVVFAGGFGAADRAWSIPNTTETRFAVGSVAKLFTAMMTLQLVDEGRMALDASIGEYLPEYDPPGGHQVTIRRLLAHTASLPDYVTRDFLDAHQYVPLDHDSFVDRFCMMGPDGPPRREGRYSSTHYCLLGEAIAKVTGMSYAENLQARLLVPLGLRHTGLHLHDSIVPMMAAGYLRSLSGYRNGPSAYPDLNSYGPGGMYSTVADLFRVDRALHQDPAITPWRDTLYLRIASSGFGPGHDFGLGATVADVEIGPNGAPRTLHRAGGNTAHGHTAVLHRVLEDAHTVILLTNAGPGWFDETLHQIAGQIFAILYGREYDVPTIPIERELYPIVAQEGTGRLDEHFVRLRDQGTLAVSLGGIYSLGTELLRLQRPVQALDVFELLVAEYPNSSWSHNGLGEALLANGERERAIARFRHALELNSENPQARGNLQRLGVVP